MDQHYDHVFHIQLSLLNIFLVISNCLTLLGFTGRPLFNSPFAPLKDRKVVIYTTCFVNFNKKNTGVAALKVLKKNGVEVQEAYPGCCGMPFLEQADLEKVVEQAKKVSKDLAGSGWIKDIRVITLTASCGLMLKFEWALLLPEDKNIKRLSKNVSDIDEYIVRYFRQTKA